MKLFTIIKEKSTRIEGKNFQNISKNIPLWLWTVNNLRGNGVAIYINTDSSSIISECKKFEDVFAYTRSHNHIDWEKSSDSLGSPVEDMLVEFCTKYVHNKDELVCLFHVTSPFIQYETIKKASKLINTDSACKSVQSVRKIQDFLFFNEGTVNMPINYDPTKVQRTQDLTPVYMSLGAFFIARASDIIEQNTRLPLPTLNYCLDSFESIEIDYPDQLHLARKIANGS